MIRTFCTGLGDDGEVEGSMRCRAFLGAGRNNVSETRDRSTRNASDRNTMRQLLRGGTTRAPIAVWHVVPKDRLERIQHDPYRYLTTPRRPAHRRIAGFP